MTAVGELFSTLIGIDPGNKESAYVVVDTLCRPLRFGKVSNSALRTILRHELEPDDLPAVGIEMVASYGMAVGAEVFDTCVEAGRFIEIATWNGATVQRVFRREVKLHHCHSAKAKDANITQALIDRFAPNVRNKGKGTKAEPAWFYGFHSDIWQAYALAVHLVDRALGVEP